MVASYCSAVAPNPAAMLRRRADFDVSSARARRLALKEILALVRWTAGMKRPRHAD